MSDASRESDAVSGDETRYFTVFGGVLASTLDFPELRPAPATDAPAWRFRVETGGAADEPVAALGAEQVTAGPMIRMWALRDGLRVSYDDTGDFDVLERGASIVWRPAAGAAAALARSDVIGRVLAVALHAAGYLGLHASAVETAQGTIGFIAPKFYGKSTLALALTYAGARLVTDDTLAVMPGTPPTCLPGVHTVRLRTEAAAHLLGEPARDDGDRHLVDWLDDAQISVGAAPLAALYLLAPSDVAGGAGGGAAVTRVALPSVPAAMALVAHAKTGSLLKGTTAIELFNRASAVAGAAAVYRLEIRRDLQRLDEVAATILGWHGGGLTAPVAARREGAG